MAPGVVWSLLTTKSSHGSIPAERNVFQISGKLDLGGKEPSGVQSNPPRYRCMDKVQEGSIMNHNVRLTHSMTKKQTVCNRKRTCPTAAAAPA